MSAEMGRDTPHPGGVCNSDKQKALGYTEL